MTEEEKAAKAVQDKIDQENSSKNGIIERMGNLENVIGDLAKSIKTEDHKPDFDFSAVNPVELAKSMADDPEGQKEFLENFIEHSHVDAIELVDEDGYNIMTEDLRKSIEDAETEGVQVLGLVLKTIDENNARSAKREGVIINLMSHMAKSFKETTEILTETKKEIVELKKSFGGDLSELEGNIQNAGSTEIGGSSGGENGTLEQDNTAVYAALKKSFVDGKPQAEKLRYYEFTTLLSEGCTHDELRSSMEPNELEIFESHM